MTKRVTVIGGGLAGCEAAWQLAERGIDVTLIEAKPLYRSPAHRTPLLAELVCSNSMRSDDPMTPAGMVKAELRKLGSVVMSCADAHAVPAGSALAIERIGFGQAVTKRIAAHPKIRLTRCRATRLPEADATIVATGPLTSPGLARSLAGLIGESEMYFYDAIAPIVATESIDPEKSFHQSRWSKDSSDQHTGDYINCPLDQAQYEALVQAICDSRKITPRPFEQPKFFEGCLPVEVMASRGVDVLRHGPMRPVGLEDPRTGKRPYAVVQLRPENEYKTAYNLVGFQTRMAYPEQKRVFSLIPALAEAEFVRLGSIHRNTYLKGPSVLDERLRLRERQDVRIAGLLAGVEGYIESCGLGCVAGILTASDLLGSGDLAPPPETALGSLYRHVTAEPERSFTPSNVNFGLMPPLNGRFRKRDRRIKKAERAHGSFDIWLASLSRHQASAA